MRILIYLLQCLIGCLGTIWHTKNSQYHLVPCLVKDLIPHSFPCHPLEIKITHHVLCMLTPNVSLVRNLAGMYNVCRNSEVIFVCPRDIWCPWWLSPPKLKTNQHSQLWWEVQYKNCIIWLYPYWSRIGFTRLIVVEEVLLDLNFCME